jgi:hypothetical protein
LRLHPFSSAKDKRQDFTDSLEEFEKGIKRKMRRR